MKLERNSQNPLLQASPDHPWEAGSVLNPCVIPDGGRFKMYYRATNDTNRADNSRYISSVGYAESDDGIRWNRHDQPVLAPDQPYDNLSCEDPRVTKIGDTYYCYYTAVSDAEGTYQVRIGLATSPDGITWTKHGIVGPNGSRSKAATLLSESIQGKYWWFYTWEADEPQSTIISVAAARPDELIKPPAGIIASTLENYDTFAVIKPPHEQHTFRGPEIGAPPVKTDDGWLLIYCGANTTDHPLWTINAALLDLEDPRRVLAVLPDPILSPETEEELAGVEVNVTFPSGAVIQADQLYVYYGSGDQGCCLATCKLTDLLEELKAHS